jgi:hypothetical protein
MKIEDTDCPSCGRTATLRIENVLQASPIGEFSLAGSTLKFSARDVPVLVCDECPYRLVGEYDSRHAVFRPEKLEIKPWQHCTSKECTYTLSHTAKWCGYEQPRRCTCAYCYEKEK